MYQIFIPTIQNEIVSIPIVSEVDEFIKLLLTHPNQQHSQLSPNPLLMQLAQQRANDLANRNYVAHVDTDGYGPNYHAKCLGYVLPSYYGNENGDNNIESIEAGSETAKDAFANLINELYHRQHLLGELDFYKDQTQYGIARAYNENSDYKWYWVIEIAKPSS